jgi:hypothetical protein
MLRLREASQPLLKRIVSVAEIPSNSGQNSGQNRSGEGIVSGSNGHRARPLRQGGLSGSGQAAGGTAAQRVAVMQFRVWQGQANSR